MSKVKCGTFTMLDAKGHEVAYHVMAFAIPSNNDPTSGFK
ncbi:uncharacterized protein G2W53_022607 [Senna tora]|uniref:Uncharacterized protein n=1 Tax=Senna tora TaxID=362788 RepID=A0A834WKN7_9FABA|nr:uncharacterized protein G2W53_022607 [Senna tora]